MDEVESETEAGEVLDWHGDQINEAECACDDLEYVHYCLYLDGFVANSYKWPCLGHAILGRKLNGAYYDIDGKWTHKVFTYDRKRSYGKGPWRTGGKSEGASRSF